MQSSDNRYYLPISIHTHRSSSPVVGSGLLSVRDLTSISVIYNVGMSGIAMGGGLAVAGELRWPGV